MLSALCFKFVNTRAKVLAVLSGGDLFGLEVLPAQLLAVIKIS